MQRVNLLNGFPFPANRFDFVYSSHVIEHFTLKEARFLLREAYRVLKPGGVIRAVVPDLEGTAREYLRIIDLPEANPEKQRYYEWITIELLDQLVRTTSGGAMGPFFQSTIASGDEQMLAYIRSRIETKGWMPQPEQRRKSFVQRLTSITSDKLSQKATYWYLACIKSLIPERLRAMIVNDTSIGEKHRWMYDRYGFKQLMVDSEFVDVSFRHFNESVIPGFIEDNLDSNPDGSPYKNVSIYCEARKRE